MSILKENIKLLKEVILEQKSRAQECLFNSGCCHGFGHHARKKDMDVHTDLRKKQNQQMIEDEERNKKKSKSLQDSLSPIPDVQSIPLPAHICLYFVSNTFYCCLHRHKEMKRNTLWLVTTATGQAIMAIGLYIYSYNIMCGLFVCLWSYWLTTHHAKHCTCGWFDLQLPKLSASAHL